MLKRNDKTHGAATHYYNSNMHINNIVLNITLIKTLIITLINSNTNFIKKIKIIISLLFF